MNHLRRRWSAVLVLLVASSVAACTDENVTVSADEPPMAEFPPNRWVDLPRSPVGDWDSFNWVFLADRSGFVHAGAATTDPDGTVTIVDFGQSRLLDSELQAAARFVNGRPHTQINLRAILQLESDQRGPVAVQHARDLCCVILQIEVAVARRGSLKT